MEAVDDYLARANLLSVVQGEEPLRVKALAQYDLDRDLPELLESHRDYEKRKAARAELRRKIEQNDRQAREYTLDDWTKIATTIFASLADNAPLLRKTIRDQTCLLKLKGIGGGRYDGPLAYKLLRAAVIVPPHDRTEADKNLYKLADRFQVDHRLPDGCSGAEFEAKAYAFIHRIMPNLPQAYTPSDAADRIITMLPKSLGADGRRIKAEAKAGGYLHDLSKVTSKCKEVVVSEQKEGVRGGQDLPQNSS